MSDTATLASPGLTAGRGLKPSPGEVSLGRSRRIARPHGRARIETPKIWASPAPPSGIARPHGRARIETIKSG